LRDALANDEVVVMQADRVMPGQKGVRVPLLGGHIELPTGPVRMAQLSGSPIVPVFTVRRPDGRIRLFIEPAITVSSDVDASGTNGTTCPHPAILRTAAVLEKYLAAYPDQWLMFQPAWCEDIEALKAASDPVGGSRGTGL
jgi:KDO2-lipid IV(A) lauroyltransferase